MKIRRIILGGIVILCGVALPMIPIIGSICGAFGLIAIILGAILVVAGIIW